MHSPRALDLSPPGGGANRPAQQHHGQQHQKGVPGASMQSSRVTPPPPVTGATVSAVVQQAISQQHHPHPPDNHEGTVSPPVFQQPPVSAAATAAFIAAAAAAAAASTSPTSDHESNHHPDRSPRIRAGRRGRGGRSSRSERMSAAAIGGGSPRSLSEMSVRGLDLLRYATLAPDGTYRLIHIKIRVFKTSLNGDLGVSNVNGCKFQSTSRISIASKGMPFCTTRGLPVKSFHVQYVRRSSPDRTR